MKLLAVGVLFLLLFGIPALLVAAAGSWEGERMSPDEEIEWLMSHGLSRDEAEELVS